MIRIIYKHYMRESVLKLVVVVGLMMDERRESWVHPRNSRGIKDDNKDATPTLPQPHGSLVIQTLFGKLKILENNNGLIAGF